MIFRKWVLLFLPFVLNAQHITKQKMQNPIIINNRSITQLLALDGMYVDTLKEFNPGSNWNAKRFWLTNLVNHDKISWNLYNENKGDYRVTLLINAKKGSEFKVSCGAYHILIKTEGEGWQRAVSKTFLPIPKIKSVIKLEIVETNSPVEIKSIELVNRQSELAIQRRIKAFKGDSNWMKNAGYGIMVQGGGWSYPPTGDKKPWPVFAKDFDAKAFVEKVYEMGGSYIVWSATWIDFLFPAPIKAIGNILPNRISKRDLIGDLIKECQAKNIKFMLYYHMGHGQKDVLKAKGWLEGPQQSYKSRIQWLNTEKKILTEVGNRYGTGLNAIFLDDGCTWYPADFEKLGKAAKAGNPKRLIAYNPWIAPSLTPFQDFYAGEDYSGSETAYKLQNGIISEGPQKGLQLFGCFVFDGPNWGIYQPNTVIEKPKNWSANQIVDLTHKLIKAKYSIAFNLLMYEDGSFSEDSFNMLKQAAMELKRGKWSE